MNKEELIKKLEDIEWEDFEMINGWDSHYHLKPLIEGDFDLYKITFPTTQKTTLDDTIKDTITSGCITYFLDASTSLFCSNLRGDWKKKI